MRLRRLRFKPTPFLLAALVALSGPVDADGSILHEFIPEDAAEDLKLSVSTIEGNLPAAVQTPSGIATAPDPSRPPNARNPYGGQTMDDSPESTYEPDRDTRKPNIENYEDPFTPATAPFKRLRAFDAVLADYTLAVRNKTLTSIPVGGSLGPGEEPFYGDFSVSLLPDQPVRIPTVGPGTHLLRLNVNPDSAVEVVRDGADNWFVKGRDRKVVRMVVQLGILRSTFGSAFADVGWPELDRFGTPQPAAHRAAFATVAEAIGISRSMRPSEVLEKMVGYFRSFEPSDDPPRGRDDIYLDLALTKKGVCRHRSFAFLVTALNIGIPARMVVNEAHAWVEVFDNTIWHRIDLGGAALNMQNNEEQADKPQHQPPADPYEWPANQDSGQELANRARSSAGGPNASSPDQNGTTPNPDGSASPTASAAPSTSNPTETQQPIEPGASPAEIMVTATVDDVLRGAPVHLQGQVRSAGNPCPFVRVDVMLRGVTAAEAVQIGSLSTNDRGEYNGAVTIPYELSLGDYELSLRTPGGAKCAAGQSK